MSKKHALIAVAFIISLYVGFTYFSQSSFMVTKDRLLDENLDQLNSSQAIDIHGKLDIDLSGFSGQQSQMTYLFKLKHNINQKDMTLHFHPALEAIDTGFSIILDEQKVSVYYSIMEEKDILAYEESLKTGAIDSRQFMASLLEGLLEEKTDAENTLQKEIIEVVHKGKQVKVYGYSLLNSVNIGKSIDPLEGWIMENKEKFDLTHEDLGTYKDVLGKIDLKTKLSFDQDLVLKGMMLHGFYKESPIFSLSLNVDLKDQVIDTMK